MDFAPNIPSEIVKKLLERGSEVAAKSAERAAEFARSREQIRASLSELICEVGEESLTTVSEPSLAAIDGAMICDSKSIGDLCTAAAVRVGPSDVDCDCDIWMDSVSRSASNKEVLGGIMSSMEVELASSSKADIVLLDGSLLSTLINISKGLNGSRAHASALSDRLQTSRSGEFREKIMEILCSSRFIAMPKYTTTNEFAADLPMQFRNHDARTIVTMALKPGEMTFFSVRETEGNRTLIGPSLGFKGTELDSFNHALDGVISCYYRPHPWTPAFRLDMTLGALEDPSLQLHALKAVHSSTKVSGMREPLPLYLVDLFAKNVSVGSAPVVDMSALAAIQDPDARLLLAMGYRT